MADLAVWRVRDRKPVRVQLVAPELEAHLEDWIEKDPSLIGGGMTIVARQFPTPAGPIDLLALDPQGTWVIIEIKRNAVRRETIAQALDYASCIATMDVAGLTEAAKRAGSTVTSAGAERELRVVLVGTSRDPGLERIVDFMAERFDFPISVVTFSYMREGDAEYLMREIIEADTVTRPTTPRHGARAQTSLEEVRKVAEHNGVLPIVDAFVKAAVDSNLLPQPYAKSVMMAPPWNRNRMVFTVSAERWKDGKGRVALWAEPFVEFANVGVEDARRIIGTDGWHYVTADEANRIAREITQLLKGRIRDPRDDRT